MDVITTTASPEININIFKLHLLLHYQMLTNYNIKVMIPITLKVLTSKVAKSRRDLLLHKKERKTMAQHLSVGWKDVNTLTAKNKFWVNDAATAISALQHLANLSNAQIVSAYMVQPIATADLNLKNAAVAANNESVNTKVKVRMSGADVGSVANPRADAIVTIPAPLGSLINGIVGDPANPLLTPLIGVIQTNSDVETDRIDKVYYARAR